MEQFAVVIGTPDGVQWVTVAPRHIAEETARETVLKPDEIVMVVPVMYHRAAE